MQIRCQNCHKPFALGKEAVHSVLDEIQSGDMTYYNYHCPHCSKVNRISKEELLRAAPDWKGTVETRG